MTETTPFQEPLAAETEQALKAKHAHQKTEKKARSGAKSQQARYEATKRLIAEHHDEFVTYYNEAAERLGLRTRAVSREAKIEKLKAQLAELEGDE